MSGFKIRKNSYHENLFEREDDRRDYTPLAESELSEAGPSNQDSQEERENQNVYLRRQVKLAVTLSVCINLVLFFVKGSAWLMSNSYAVFSSLVDSTVDLINQLVLFVAERDMAKPSVRFPAGKTRLEPVAIIVNAVLMCTLSLNVIRVASEGLFDGIFGDEKPELEVTMATKAILISATALKIGLFILCNRLRKVSGTAMALAEDHRNDVMSNVTAITTAVIAFHCPNVWWMDPAGALVISAYIIWCWVNVGKEQARFVVGETADDELIERIKIMANTHHASMQLDQIRVYHIGRHYLVELEVVMPPQTTLLLVHDISLDLQKKVEQVPDVERAFVHVDYETRDHKEHKEPRLL